MTYVGDPDDNSGALPPAAESLRDLVLAQGQQETGIFVLLFTSESASGDAGHGNGHESVQLVGRLADELGVDEDSLQLFSHDAYVLQAALGEASLPRTT